MRAPSFWDHDGVVPRLLWPASVVYRLVEATRTAPTASWRSPVPVLCVGNLTVGGAGKTPTALAIAERLIERGHRPHFLIRGYGGRERGPLEVDLERHRSNDVGDEAILLARLAPTWVGGNRRQSAALAIEAGADVLVMDDGFQNRGLFKDLSLIVVDRGYGFGNQRLFPAGPLRESVEAGLARAQAVVAVGDGEPLPQVLSKSDLPIMSARLVATDSARALRGRRLVAFAGIGRPEKFFATLDEIGAKVVVRRRFPDHHRYRAEDIMAICEEADALKAEPVTTEKDYVRLDSASKSMVRPVGVRLEFEDPPQVDALLDDLMAR